MIEVNPWSRQAGGPCPCRCRRSQQRLPQRESRPKQTELSSLEFPFLSRPAIHTSCLAAPLVAPLNPMVHRLRRQCGTSKGTVSLGTQLRGVRSKTCQRAAGWCGFNSPVFSAATAGRRGAAPVTENAGSRGGRRHMILGGILQSMGALKGNRVACHSPFPQRLDQISLIGIIAEQANVTRLPRHRRLERRIRSTLHGPADVRLAAKQFDLRLPFLFHCRLRNHGSLVRFCRQQRTSRRMRLCRRSGRFCCKSLCVSRLEVIRLL